MGVSMYLSGILTTHAAGYKHAQELTVKGTTTAEAGRIEHQTGLAGRAQPRHGTGRTGNQTG